MAAPAEPRVCSIARALEVVGEKWALLAVREVFLGNRRFDEMIRRTGAPRDTLAARLRTLVDAGILRRHRYSDHPQRFEYHLTTAGRDLYPVILTLLRWGDEHLAGPQRTTADPRPQLRAPPDPGGHLSGLRGGRRSGGDDQAVPHQLLIPQVLAALVFPHLRLPPEVPGRWERVMIRGRRRVPMYRAPLGHQLTHTHRESRYTVPRGRTQRCSKSRTSAAISKSLS